MKKFIYLAFLMLVAGMTELLAQPVNTPTILFTGVNKVIGAKTAVYEDPTGQMAFSAIQYSDKFKPAESANPDFGLSKSTFWIKFTVSNQSDNSRLMLDLQNPTITDCYFYFPENGQYKTTHLTNRMAVRNRKYKHQDFLFDIILPSDSTFTYYLRIKSTEQLIIPMILGSRLDIIRSKMDDQMLWGIFIGIVLVMAAYNFLLFIFTNEKTYLWYVLYCLFIGLTQTTLNGITYHYLLGSFPWILNKVFIIFPALAGIFAMLFVRRFLETKKRSPRLHKLFPIPITLYILAVVFRFSGLDLISFRMIDISALATTLLIYGVAIVISFQGYRPAKYFLIAWTLFFVGIIMFSLRNLGVLPYNSFTSYTMGLGTALELTLLSIALADRINVLKREKQLSQAKALRAANLTERIIREQNISLEQKVNERTSALKYTLDELKQAESQLVQSEKMATLGQLTAGIAHEINNPINFVTSNVSPLKRDIDILFAAIDHFQQLALSEGTTSEKATKIKQYLEDQELPYLRTEIPQLMNGIHNGASRTAEIVKGLKQFSRLDEDSLKFASVNEGIDSTMIILSNQLGNIIVTKSYGELPSIECYPGKLNQVYLNILSNAIYAINKKFDGKPGGTLDIITRLTGDEVEIAFTDNGTGMEDSTLKKIFNPFFTTKDTNEGTGLGLSISDTIIKNHHGTLSCTTAEGQGAKFIITLPVHQGTITNE